MEKIELKPCPFCGCEMKMLPMAKSWLHRGVGNHHPDCYLHGVPVRVDKTWNNREFDWSKADKPIKNFKYTGVNPPEWLEVGK